MYSLDWGYHLCMYTECFTERMLLRVSYFVLCVKMKSRTSHMRYSDAMDMSALEKKWTLQQISVLPKTLLMLFLVSWLQTTKSLLFSFHAFCTESSTCGIELYQVNEWNLTCVRNKGNGGKGWMNGRFKANVLCVLHSTFAPDIESNA